MKSNFAEHFVGGLGLGHDDVKLHIVHTVTQVSQAFPDSPLLPEWKIADSIATALKTGDRKSVV